MIETPATGPHPLVVTYEPTVDDHVAAGLALAPRNRKMNWRREVLVTAVCLVAAVAIVRGGPPMVSGMMLFAACVVLGGVGVLFGAPVLRRRSLVRHREQHPALYGPVEFTLGADGLRMASALQTTDVPWSSLDRAYEANGLFLFRLAGSTAYFVPRRALREHDEPRLRALVAAHLGPRAELTNPTDGR